MSDRDVLEDLYRKTGGERWVHNDNWLSDRPLGEWYGVRTDGITGRVWALDLPANGLHRKLTPRLGELDELVRLDLSANSLDGEIPPELAGCRRLKILLLRDNELEGRIPGELGGLPALEELALDNNRMEGPISAGLGLCPALRGLWLSGCSFSGPIPEALAGCTRLRALDLAHNELSGEIPWRLGAAQELDHVYLAGNALTGGIPEELWKAAHHDLEDLAEELGRRVTGHIAPSGMDGREIRITTCPEWPSRELHLVLREQRLTRDIREGELVWVLYTRDHYGTLWAENIASRAGKEEAG